MGQDHLSVPTPHLYTKGVVVYKPKKLHSNADNTSDSKRITFCSWNPGPFSKQRPDPQRQLAFILNHGISVLQEADREGPFVVAAYQNDSSFTCAGEATGLVQIQSGRGYCCSCEYWPPELARSGTLYRAFLTYIGQPASLRKHFPDMRGNVHASRRGDQISAAGWQLSCHGIWLPKSEESPGRMQQRGDQDYLIVCNIHLRPDQARSAQQNLLLLQSLFRLCFKTKCMIMTGDFNQGYHVLDDMIEQFQTTPGKEYLQKHEVEGVTAFQNPGHPEIRLVLIRYQRREGWTFELVPQFQYARCADLGLHPYDTDAHPPITGHLVSTIPHGPHEHMQKHHVRSEEGKKQPEQRKKQRRKENRGLDKSAIPLDPPRVVLQKCENGPQIDWINRQWRSSYQNGLVRQFSEAHDGQTGRWIFRFTQVPRDWKPPQPFILNHDYWMIPRPWLHEESEEETKAGIPCRSADVGWGGPNHQFSRVATSQQSGHMDRSSKSQ